MWLIDQLKQTDVYKATANIMKQVFTHLNACYGKIIFSKG